MITDLNEFIKISRNKKIRTIVMGAKTRYLLMAAKEAYDKKIIEPVLVGSKKQIERIAGEINFDLKKIDIYNEINEEKIIKKSLKLISEDLNAILVKGDISFELILKGILDKKNGLLEKGNLLSHIGIGILGKNKKKIIGITDGGIVLSPTLEKKVKIINNAVNFFRQTFDFKEPKVGILSAVEVLNPNMPPTLDAALLTQMNKRGQIKNCIIDGPLSLDCLVDKSAIKHKQIKSEINGEADIILVPNVTVGNLLNKAIVYLTDYNKIYINLVLGAKMPIVMSSRTDNYETLFLSIACVASNFKKRSFLKHG